MNTVVQACAGFTGLNQEQVLVGAALLYISSLYQHLIKLFTKTLTIFLRPTQV